MRPEGSARAPRAGTRPARAASLLVRIDSGGHHGLQKQIYAEIRRAILAGVVPPGARVSSSRALARELGVSRTTTLLALEQLLAEGYLEARRASGTFVARDLPEDLPLDHGGGPPPAARHPPLSRRGRTLAGAPASAERVPGPPRPFRIGVPAVDVFPARAWAKLVARRARSLAPEQLDYGEAAGYRPLRQAIAGHVSASRGTRCDPDQVFVLAGAQRALDLAFHLLLDAGDEAWLEEPGYPGARAALLAAGARIRSVAVDDEGLDVEAGARRFPRARLAFATPSHQFPLGVPMSLARRLALLQWAARARAWVVEDDYDSEYRYGARPIPCLHGLDADGRVIYVGSFSKTLFPALRLGFVVVPPDLRDAFVAVRRATDLHPPRLDQAVLADFIEGGHYERHLRRVRAACRERLEALHEALGRHCAGALRLRPVATGLHAVADLALADARRTFDAARERGVEVMPLAAYYLGRSRAPNALVLGFGAARPEAIAGGVERLAAAIEAARRGRGAKP